jgi:hypothetical protein
LTNELYRDKYTEKDGRGGYMIALGLPINFGLTIITKDTQVCFFGKNKILKILNLVGCCFRAFEPNPREL